ncbi:hypothetical protein AVEN_110950-1 [Araneus ventricosus]|uniref:Uncharacterized protein n=1 Tax=Araneus ventricosus TaxID=182803 RepID=A0A4Y2HD93_ARAVE|nr:hypothetical protein AVEN_110950-1 [Araneus ventricosus]
MPIIYQSRRRLANYLPISLCCLGIVYPMLDFWDEVISKVPLSAERRIPLLQDVGMHKSSGNSLPACDVSSLFNEPEQQLVAPQTTAEMSCHFSVFCFYGPAYFEVQNVCFPTFEPRKICGAEMCCVGDSAKVSLKHFRRLPWLGDGLISLREFC